MAKKIEISEGGKQFHNMIFETDRDVFAFFPIISGTILFAAGLIPLWQQVAGAITTGVLLFYITWRE